MGKDQIRQKMSTGIKIIISILGIFICGQIFSIFTNMSFKIGLLSLNGISAKLAFVLIFTLNMLCFYGIKKRHAWARKLAIGLFIYNMVFILINLISFFIKPELINIFFLIVLLIFWIMALMIINYLLRKKDYFVN